ncbi:hypothetical protein P9139_00880 [Curtobacterium flaccumfaciens]|nr:hypothetical protein P9139_00880 [Curtobacterium flaccumfaciens]
MVDRHRRALHPLPAARLDLGASFPHAGREYSFESHPAVGWSLVTVGFAVAGLLVAIARRGAARYDEHAVMGLALAGVVGTTVLVWLLMPAQTAWVQWAVEHGRTHPFVVGNVTEHVRYAGSLG